MFLSKGNLGYIISEIGGIVALFAFFALPYISLGFLGSATGSQLANMNSQFIQGTGALWLEPLVAVIIIGIAGYQIFRNKGGVIAAPAGKGGAVGLIILGALTLVALLIKYAIDAQPPSQSGYSYSGLTLASLYGSGFWTYAISMIIVLAGGIVQAGSS